VVKSSLIGRKLGKYEIIELIGQGGMATVYKGYQQDIDRYVAIKVLPPHPGQDMQFVDRFMLEARTIARLQHPHILPVYDFGTQDDILYLAIAYVQGGSLSDRIDRGPMPMVEVERVLSQLAAALDYAHRQGVIHRDIKPDNVLLDGEGNVLLADFGIAKLVGGDTRLTATGGLVGTPAYIAPEQGQGLPLSGSADIYSLGVVVYEMITGKQPYTAETPMQIVLKHMTEPVPRITREMPGLPTVIEEVMLRVLAKHPADRYESAMTFAQDFSRALRSTESGLKFVPSPMPAGLSGESQTVNFTMPSAANATQMPSPGQTMTPGQTTLMQPGGNSVLLLGGLGIIALLIVVIVALVVFVIDGEDGDPDEGTLVAVQTTPQAETTPLPNFGSLTFSSVNATGDTVNLRVERVSPTTVGEQYVVWLRNTDTGDTIALGALNTDAFGSGVLTYTDPDGRLLPSLTNAVLITREPAVPEDSPTGEVVYSGSVPLEVTDALGEILLASEQGSDGSSLLAAAIGEAEIGAQHAGLAASSTSLGGMQTHAEHTINILLGGETDYNGNGRGENPGRTQLGVPYYLDLIEERLDTAITAAGTTPQLQAEAELIRVCLDNTRLRIDEVVGMEEQIFSAESMEAIAEQVAQGEILAQAVLDGVDLNENNQVEPFEGECGLRQIERYGVLVGGMSIMEGSLPTLTSTE
jgi:serine/threonine protein kinase